MNEEEEEDEMKMRMGGWEIFKEGKGQLRVHVYTTQLYLLLRSTTTSYYGQPINQPLTHTVELRTGGKCSPILA